MINAGILVIAAVPVLVGLVYVVLRYSVSPSRALLLLALAAYGFAVVATTLFPIPYQRELIDFERSANPLTYNFVPLRTVSGAFSDGLASPAFAQVVGNVALFLPFGYLTPLAFRRHRSLRSLMVLGLTVSLSIELLQLMMSGVVGYAYKIVDVDDLLLNAAGSALGYGVYRILGSASLELLNIEP